VHWPKHAGVIDTDEQAQRGKSNIADRCGNSSSFQSCFKMRAIPRTIA
jgi:hypothetical protein